MSRLTEAIAIYRVPRSYRTAVLCIPSQLSYSGILSSSGKIPWTTECGSVEGSQASTMSRLDIANNAVASSSFFTESWAMNSGATTQRSGHGFGNVEEVIGAPTKGRQLFTKIAGKDEPERYTFHVVWGRSTNDANQQPGDATIP